MRNAEDVAKKAKLGRPKYGRPDGYKSQPCWYIEKFGGEYYEWCWHPESNGCWKRRSVHPLFDTKEILAVA